MAKYMKQWMADELRRDLDESPNLLVVGLLPMDAEATVELRSSLRDQGARLRVIHNRTSRFALDEDRQGLAELFVGQTAITLVPGEEPDVITVAKTLVEASKNKWVELRGGFFEGEILDEAGVELLAKTPDKDTLRAMLCGLINGPARGVAVSMQAVAGGLARCLQARVDEAGETSE